MEALYTNVLKRGNYILFRGYDDRGSRIHERFLYSPTLFVPSKTPTGYKTIYGQDMMPKVFDTIGEARKFVEEYEDIENFQIYGNQSYEYCFISDICKGKINPDFSKIRVAYLDIETAGKEDPHFARLPITAFSIEYKGNFYVLAYKDYTGSEKDIKFIRCKNEIDMLEKFLQIWKKLDVDVVSGWNTSGFDIPYIVNRIRNVMGDEAVTRLSPWGYIYEKEVFFKGQKKIQYILAGLSSLDYLELYQKFSPNRSQENYKLNTIANVELGEKKISYEEYGSLDNLYEQNFNLFIEYNRKDVDLVKRLEKKLRLLELAFFMAYMNKVNFTDVFHQVRMWDSITFNVLRSKKQVVPPKVIKTKDSAFAGAFVKEPRPNMYKWVASFDLNSLYPHIMRQWNISPETIVPDLFREINLQEMIKGEYDTSYTKDFNVCVAGNGHHYRLDKPGFMGEIIMEMYQQRKEMKKKKLEYEKQYELIEAEMERRKHGR